MELAQARLDIAKLYLASFNRVADATGLDYWTTRYMNGETLSDIAQLFTGSAEYKAKYPEVMLNSEYVAAIYQNVFGRTADAAGQAHWESMLANGTATKATLMNWMVSSALNDDALRLANQAEFAVQSVVQNLDPVVTSAQLPNITADAASVQTALTGSANGQTFTLTTGIDSGSAFVGTTGGDTFNAATDTSGTADKETLTSLDTINGGAGIDTLNIISTDDADFVANAAGVTVSNVEIVNLTSTTTTTLNTSAWTGLQTLNVNSIADTTITAAATTDVNELTSVNDSTITGGKNVTVVKDDTLDSDIIITETAGTVTVTSEIGDVFIGGNATGNDADADTDVLGAVNVTMAGDDADLGVVTIGGATTIAVTASAAVSLAQRTADAAAKAASAAAEAAAETAEQEAIDVVTDLTALKAAIAADTTATAVRAETCGYIIPVTATAAVLTNAQKLAIDHAYASTYASTSGVASVKAAAAQAAAVAVIQPMLDAAIAAKDAAVAAENVAEAADAAQDEIAAANVVIATAVGAVDVTATQNTALESVTITGNYGAANAITDASASSNTLTTVTLENAAGGVITGDAVATINLIDFEDALEVINTTTDNALTFNIQNSDIDNLDLDSNGSGVTKTLNLVATGSNDVDVANVSTVTAVNISGTGNTTIVNTGAFAAAAVITNTSTGNVTLTLAAAGGQTYVGGAGVDTITATVNAQAETVDGGAGTADVIHFLDAVATGTDDDEAEMFENFEVLSVATGVAVDADLLVNSTFTSYIVNGTSTINNIHAGRVFGTATTTDVLVGLGGAFTLDITDATVNGNIDTVNLTMADSTTLGAVSLAGIEHVNVDLNGEDLTISALTSALSVNTLTVEGEGDVNITTGAVSVIANAVYDFEDVDGDVTIDASLSTDNGLTIKGSLTGVNTIDTGVEDTNVYGGAGNDTITGNNGDDRIMAGEGNNTIDTGNGANIVTAGNGNNDVTGGTGVDTITLGNGFNFVDADAGNDVITIGTGGVCEIVTDGTVGIIGGAGNDTITLGTAAAGAVRIIVTDAIDTDGIDTIVGFTSSDLLVFNTAGLMTVADDYTDLTATDFSAQGTLAEAADAALTAAANGSVQIVAFTYDADGDEVNETYLVADLANADGYVDSDDSIVEITGTVASTLTVNNFIVG
jgi:hypothetical protein